MLEGQVIHCDWCDREIIVGETPIFTHPDTSDRFCSPECVAAWDKATRS